MNFRVESGFAVRPHQGLSCCGDAAVVAHKQGVSLFALADALGHGPDAAKSAKALAAHVEGMADRPLREVFERSARVLQGLRGAVMSMVRVSGGTVVFAGIGNVELYGPPGARRPATSPGTLGGPLRHYSEHPLSVEPGQRWVLASDGLKARDLSKSLEASRALAPYEAAQKLIELAGRENDDAGVVVLDFWEAT
jgi:negative regulator of sigma-B (phosphoserine phosphatase)